jgi:hypothetical protein
VTVIDRVPKPRTPRACIIAAVTVALLWLASFGAALYFVVQGWGG